MINQSLECYIPVSVIIPCLNEQQGISDCLLTLHPLRERGCEVIVVDGGSEDKTAKLAGPLADHTLLCAPGRARQMNHGASYASGEWLLFLHADTRLPKSIDAWLDQLYQTPLHWGFFPLRLSGQHWLLRLIERAISYRSRTCRIATGDQCLFVRRQLFEQMQGYADIMLMEDVELTRRLRRITAPFVYRQAVVSSSRRWEQRGILRTVLLMWRLRWAYFWGASTEQLHKSYYE